MQSPKFPVILQRNIKGQIKMDNTKQRIMECCIKEVIENDLKTITMDSIAKKLAISKKTIYEHFNNKEMLIEDTLLFYSNF